MDETQVQEELLNFFKALAEPTRLKIVGLLAKESLSVEQIAEILNVKPPTVSHHLSKLSKAGLVSAHSESYYNIYRLELKTIESMSHRLLSNGTIPSFADDLNLDAYDQKIVRNFTGKDGKLKSIPSQQKKFEAILRYLVVAFDEGKKYTEKEINEILSGYYPDTASLRRGLIEYKLMDRESGGSAYWRID